MKRYLKHIILFLTLLPMMTACVLDSDPTENCSDNEVVVSLSVSSRAVEGSQLDDGLPDDIKLWVYGQETTADNEDNYKNLAYINKSSNIFIGRDLYGNPVESLKQVIENGKDYYKLHFYVVLNSGNVTSTTTTTLKEGTSISDLKAFTFTDIETDKTDNQMIMYGYNSLTIGTQTNYELSIQVERAVAKLEFFVTKENSSASLTITEMKLNKIPDKGFLTTPATTTSGLTFRDSGISYLSEETSIPDGKHLSQTEAQLGNFWQFEESRFVKMPLTQPYLMENPNGGTWTDDNNKHDYTYPTTDGYKTENGYVLTVSYQLGGSSETTTQTIYLPKIERNHLYKIYARVMGGNDVQFTLKVANWDDVNIDKIDFKDIVSYTIGGWDQEPLSTYNVVINKTDNKEAVFKFSIDTPSDCKYGVLLNSNQDLFGLQLGTETDTENNTTWITVTVSAKDAAILGDKTSLSFYAYPNGTTGKSWELDMTGNGGNISEQAKSINHFNIIVG